MKLEDLLKPIVDLNRTELTQEILLNNTKKIVDEFNEKYQIVPKEMWCVTFTLDGSIDATSVQGPFDSEEIANLFATIWNRKREEFIDKTIEANPDGDHYFPYIKAKPNKLDWSEKFNEIQTEISEALKEF